MIGKKIKSYRHLFRESNEKLATILILFGHDSPYYEVCKVVKAKVDGVDELLIFNNSFNFGCHKFNTALKVSGLSADEINMLTRTYCSVTTIFSDGGHTALNRVTNEIILLPETFESDYSNFLSSNGKMIRSLIDKCDLVPESATSIYLYSCTEGSKNFFLWAVNAHYQNGTSLDTINRVMVWHKLYGNLSSKLSKKTITAYTSSNLIPLFDEMCNLRREKRTNNVINSFNTAQKKLLKNTELGEKDMAIISRLYRLSKTKKENFIRKVSTITDFDELMRQMKLITSTHFEWNKDSFMDFLHNVDGMEYDIISDDKDVVLLRVKNYETVKYLAKTTSWCISKNKLYWNQYVSNGSDSQQYVLFDFSKKEDDTLSIVGFTCQYNRGITNAHDFVNNNILGADVTKNLLNSFISVYGSDKNIYSILDRLGIDLYQLVSYDKPLYEWNKKAMYDYLYSCVDKSNVTILCDNGDLVAISVIDENVRYFLGDIYMDSIESHQWSWQHIIFMDFSKNQKNPNRILTAIISNGDNSSSYESYCSLMFNEHMKIVSEDFDVKLSQFGLPYDVIRRQGGLYEEAASAFTTYNMPLLNKVITDGETLKKVISRLDVSSVESYISVSVTRNVSFDYLNLFYKNGLRLHDALPGQSVSNILETIMVELFHLNQIPNRRGMIMHVPTEEDVRKFYEMRLPNAEIATSIGHYLAILKIIDTEGDDDIMQSVYSSLCSHIYRENYEGEILDSILAEIGKKIDFKNKETGLYWLTCVTAKGGEKAQKLLSELKNNGMISDYTPAFKSPFATYTCTSDVRYV